MSQAYIKQYKFFIITVRVYIKKGIFMYEHSYILAIINMIRERCSLFINFNEKGKNMILEFKESISIVGRPSI